MLRHLTVNKLINEAQHGFLAGLSTATNLLSCINDWSLSLQNRHGVTVIYIDFAKAFDTVCHEKLLYRLGHLGVGGNLLRWLRNFLSNRTHYTRVGNGLSDILKLISGVIQGSNIGPLLFISFINELADLLGQLFVTAKFFADDLKMYAEIVTRIDVENFQTALNLVASWCNDWQMQISVNKCCFLRIGPTNIADLGLHIDGFCLPEVKTVKDLGITFDTTLSLSSHVVNIVSTANQRMNLLYRAFFSRSLNTLVKAYITYIRPLLEYNTVVWSPHKKCDIQLVEKVQRRFTKQLPGLRNMTYAERLAVTGLHTLELRRLHADLIMCYKIVFHLTKLDFNEFFLFAIRT